MQAIVQQVACDGQVVVLEENASADRLYIIDEGAVAVTKRLESGAMEFLSLLTQGDCFGEMVLFSTEQRSATVVTVEPTKLSMVLHTDFVRFAAAHPRAGMQLYHTVGMALCQRLRAMNDKLRDLVEGGLLAETSATPQSGAASASAGDTAQRQVRLAATLIKGIADLYEHPEVSDTTRQHFLRVMQQQAAQLQQALVLIETRE